MVLKKVRVTVSHIEDLLIVPVKGYFPSFSHTHCGYDETETRINNRKAIIDFIYSEKSKWFINF
jgi:hypothetical protein